MGSFNFYFNRHPVWKSATKVSSLARSMVSVFLQLKQTLTQHKHYLFTPKDLTTWCLGMVRYLLPSSSQDHRAALEAFSHQACHLFRDKLVSGEDRAKYDSAMASVLQSDWSYSPSNADEAAATFATAGDANFSPGSPLPMFGRLLGKISLEQWSTVVERGTYKLQTSIYSLHQKIYTFHFTLKERCCFLVTTETLTST